MQTGTVYQGRAGTGDTSGESGVSWAGSRRIATPAPGRREEEAVLEAGEEGSQPL